MTGIIKGCELAGVELIGGETAEHPMTFDIDLWQDLQLVLLKSLI